MSDIEAINETNNEARMPDNEAIESTTIEKPKKPRTEKQLEAFKKVQEKRKQNIELKKSGAKVESKPVIPDVQKELPPKETKVKKYKEVIESESDSEEEIIIKRKPKKQEIVKKKKKQIVIELSDTDSDSEEEQPRYEEPMRHVETKSKFVPQQHKKYSVDVKPKSQQNYFCD